MQNLTVNELFSGIGAQKRGIDVTKVFNCEVITTSEINKEAMLSYAAVHCGLTPKLIDTYPDYPSRQEMADYLTRRNIGYTFETNTYYNWKRLVQIKDTTLEKFYLACKLSNNIGDISRVNNLPYADLWTYSYPCTDLSTAGKQKGMIKGKTRSGLLYEVERLLETTNTPPKYLLLENVKALTNKKHKADYEKWLERLDELGYNTYWQVLNGKECGLPQNRERVFAISIRKDIDTGKYKFPEPNELEVYFKDLMDEDVDEQYYLKDTANLRIPEEMQRRLLGVRRLTPTECWRLMGFSDEDIDKCYDLVLSASQLYKQAGNSIITTCIRLLMEQLYKAQYDESHVVNSATHKLPKKPNSCKDFYCLRYERTEYAKKIRKDYESGKVKEKIANMRVLVPRVDGICNTLTTIQKDNYVLVLSAKSKIQGGV